MPIGMLSAEDIKAIRDFNRNVGWLKTQAMKEKPPSDKWVSYEEAVKVLPRSKDWYRKCRTGRIDKLNQYVAPALAKGVDWIMVGNEVEYRLESIVNLKNSIAS